MEKVLSSFRINDQGMIVEESEEKNSKEFSGREWDHFYRNILPVNLISLNRPGLSRDIFMYRQ